MKTFLTALFALLLAAPAAAQSSYPTPELGTNAQAVVPLQCNSTNTSCAPITAANPASSILKATTSGGLSSSRVLTGTSGVIKASAGQLYGVVSVRNANAAVRYLHFYNQATAPTLSTDTPVLTIALPASSTQEQFELTSIGVDFTAGIAWSYTTDNIAIPTTAGTSTELMFSAIYK